MKKKARTVVCSYSLDIFKTSCAVFILLAVLSSNVESASNPGSGSLQSKVVLKDPTLVECYDFEDLGPDVKNKAPQADAESRDGWFVEHWHHEGRFPGSRAAYFGPGGSMVTSDKSFGFKNAMTIEAWLKPVDYRNRCVIYNDWIEKDGNRSFELALVKGKVLFKISPDGKKEFGLIGNRVLDKLKWSHVVATFNNGKMDVYVNGVLDQTLQDDSVTAIYNPKDSRKRCLAQPNVGPFPWMQDKIQQHFFHAPEGCYVGFIDEIAVYTRALSAQEAAKHYRTGKPNKEQPMQEAEIYDGQDKLGMDKTFFENLFPETQPVEMNADEEFAFYDKALPSDRDASFWELNNNQAYVDGWKKHVSENTVYHALLRNFDKEGGKNWEIGIGKAGQLYSWRGAWGEVLPPQFMPWTDEAWQATSFTGQVGGILHELRKLGGGEMGEGFVHGSGTTTTQYPPTSYTFYDPMLARWFDEKENAYYVINWGQSPNTPTLFEHKILYYSRYKYLGDGVLEITNASFNFGDYTYGYAGIPWGGVRQSTFPNVFVSKPDGSYEYTDVGFGEPGCNNDRKDTGGWMIASQDKEDMASLTFGFVFGNGFEGKKIKGIDKPGGNMGFGHAGKDPSKVSGISLRDYIIMASNVKGTQKPGEGFWTNYFLVVGSKENVIKQGKKYADKPSYGVLDFTEANATLRTLYFDKKLMLTLEKKGNAKAVCQIYNQPITHSKPLFRIEEVGSAKVIITTNPYDLSHKADWPNVLPKDHKRYEEFNGRQTCLPHLSQDKKPLKWTLLGFVISEKNATLEASKYMSISDVVSVVDDSGNMFVRKLK